LKEDKKEMKQFNERQWRTIRCPEGKGETRVMCEWEIVSERGRILKRALKLVDCCNPGLADLGGEDCGWGCERALLKQER
jgi:hypothetical protein